MTITSSRLFGRRSAAALRPDDADRPRHRRHDLLLIAVSVAVALSTALAMIVAFPSAAAAAEIGPGYQSPEHPLDHLGAYVAADGTMAYCIDVGEPSTVGGATADAGTVARIDDLDPEAMLRLSFVLATYGTTTDPRTAAAVAMVVWDIAGDPGYGSAGGDAAVLRRAPESERAAIQVLADRFRAEAEQFAPVTPSASMAVSIDDGNDYSGFLDVSVRPSSATGAVTLTNAVFTDSGDNRRADVADGAHLAITAIPPDGSDSEPAQPYRVSAESDDFTAPGEPSPSVRLFTTPGAQTLVAAAAITPRVFSASAADSRDRAVPTVATIAQATGLVGGAIRDSAIVEHVPSSGLELSWSAYLQPAAATTATCTSDTIVFETDVPLSVTADGTYASADFTTTEAHVGTIHWIATLVRDDEVIARGLCGDPTETTVVSPAPPRLPVVSG